MGARSACVKPGDIFDLVIQGAPADSENGQRRAARLLPVACRFFSRSCVPLLKGRATANDLALGDVGGRFFCRCSGEITSPCIDHGR